MDKKEGRSAYTCIYYFCKSFLIHLHYIVLNIHSSEPTTPVIIVFLGFCISSHSLEHDISGTPWGHVFKYGTNVHLDLRMVKDHCDLKKKKNVNVTQEFIYTLLTILHIVVRYWIGDTNVGIHLETVLIEEICYAWSKICVKHLCFAIWSFFMFY